MDPRGQQNPAPGRPSRPQPRPLSLVRCGPSTPGTADRESFVVRSRSSGRFGKGERGATRAHPEKTLSPVV